MKLLDNEQMSELSPETVRLAYRLFLGRDPESAAVVDSILARYSTLKELGDGFAASAEFQAAHHARDSEVSRVYWTLQDNVDVDVSTDVLARLMDRLREQWRKLGENDPYWSVISHENLRMESIDDKKIAAFYDSGRASAELIGLFEKKTGAPTQSGVCLELGCGVGRITAHLAKRFDKVIAVDISPGNLALCERHLAECGVNNVQTVLLTSPEQLLELGKFDFFYSVIVLQHNPPPVQKVLLEYILANIRPGGGCFFQTCGALNSYAFNVDDYLNTEVAEMDVHCLPKPVVLRLLHEKGLQVRDVEIDTWVGTFGSYTYFATK